MSFAANIFVILSCMVRLHSFFFSCKIFASSCSLRKCSFSFLSGSFLSISSLLNAGSKSAFFSFCAFCSSSFFCFWAISFSFSSIAFWFFSISWLILSSSSKALCKFAKSSLCTRSFLKPFKPCS